ncbi:hypothetical protein IWW57_001159 [Coemansia sp. S610]|nr:hypothetical protein IWW57_001159 [Coemansia sp. S610]
MSTHQQSVASSGNLSFGDSGTRPQQQHQRQQQMHTPMSLTLAPNSANNNALAASAMSPLHIGGLTEQQTAEMVELLTPFLSPATTPALNGVLRRGADESRAFSPLTSPALMPQAAAIQAAIGSGGPFSPNSFSSAGEQQYRAQHMLYQQQQQQGSFVSMPPPSPSITAEHIMRRQQQMIMQQHSPSFPSTSAAALSPYLPPSMNSLGGSRLNRRRGSTSTGTIGGPAAQAGGSHLLGSPQYHPYRGPQQQQQQLQQQRQPNQSQQVYTPSLLSRATGAGDADDFFLDSLPTSATAPGMTSGPAQQTRNRTLHQLNASPHFASPLFGAGSVPPAAQRSMSLNSAALAMLQNTHGTEEDESIITAEQLNSWLEGNSRQPPATAPLAPRDQQQQSATPASLMNLPLSAHHLPHSVNGEIVSSEGTSQSPAMNSAIVSAFGRQQIASVGPSPAMAPAVSSAMSASLLQFVTQSAPMTEFVHPPIPPPLHIGPSSSVLGGRRSASAEDPNGPSAVSEDQGSGNGRRTRRKSVALATKPIAAKNPRTKRDGMSAAGRRKSRTSLLTSPRQTPLVPSTLKNVTSPGYSPHAMASPGLAPLTPATLAPRRTSQTGTPNTGPMQSNSVTPQMRPRAVIAATSTTNIVGLEADVVTRLATKSNYQNIMEGNSEFLGLTYKTEFKSGLERRRTNHKQAEQKRRDSLKTCFQALKERLPDLDPKLVSKIYLLNRANAFIDSLTRMNELLVAAAAEQGIDVEAIAAQARAADPDASYEEEGSSNDDEEGDMMDTSQ